MANKTSSYNWKQIGMRFRIVMGLFVFLGVVVVWKTCELMFVDRGYWLEVAHHLHRTQHKLLATRGNIVSADGQILATSLPEYTIVLDPIPYDENPRLREKNQALRDSLLFSDLPGLLSDLKRVIPGLDVKRVAERIRKGRRDKKHYIPLYNKRISYLQMCEVKRIPFFSLPMSKNGVQFEEHKRRMLPYGRLAQRTIGRFRNESDSAQSGLERHFDAILAGTPGVYHTMKVRGREIQVIDTLAINGCDLHTTIDVGMQDLVEKTLSQQLRAIGADAGMCILMEVETGDVKAMSSLSRLENGGFAEIESRAVTNMMEPGSVFKPMALMVAMDDGKVTMNSHVDTRDGVKMMYGRKMSDSNRREGSNGVLTVPEIIKRSSNVGISTLIDNAYKRNPDQFVDGLDRIGISEDLKLPIPGYKKPKIRHRRDNPKLWYQTTLPWMSIGYETQIPPISTLTFYNGVANGGKMMRPRFVTHITRDAETVEEYPPVVLREQMCKPSTLKNIQLCLEGVVGKNEGTGKAAYSPYFSIAGKTGTAQIWGKSGFASHYLVSFAGYFPANAPRYSMIVCIEKGGVAYGGSHCGPVFRRVAEGVMARNLIDDFSAAVDSGAHYGMPPRVLSGNLVAAEQVLKELRFSPPSNSGLAMNGWGSTRWSNSQPQLVSETPTRRMPNLYNYSLRDAVYRLERLGLRVKAHGVGRVVRQSLPAGKAFRRGQIVELALSLDRSNTHYKKAEAPSLENDGDDIIAVPPVRSVGTPVAHRSQRGATPSSTDDLTAKSKTKVSTAETANAEKRGTERETSRNKTTSGRSETDSPHQHRASADKSSTTSRGSSESSKPKNSTTSAQRSSNAVASSSSKQKPAKKEQPLASESKRKTNVNQNSTQKTGANKKARSEKNKKQ